MWQQHLPEKYNHKCIFALQSNNMFHIDDHFNCVESIDELVEKSKSWAGDKRQNGGILERENES